MYNLEPKVGTLPSIVYYKRVSTKKQAEGGYSLEVQEDLVQKLALEGHWKVEKVFEDDGKSARDIDRPDLGALLDYCDEHSSTLDAVVVQDTSRLSRNVEDHLHIKAFLRKRTIKLITLDGNNDDTDEGAFLDLIIAGVNELESRRTGRKTKRIMKAMAQKGLKPGQASLGYINSFKKGVPMYPDKERVQYFKEMFRLWNTGNYSLRDISNYLYDMGLRSRQGKKVGPSTVQSYLKDIVYAGGLSYDGGTIENAQHKAIISMEEYNKAQKMFEVRNKKADRSRKHTTLLAGIARCMKCGTLMHGEYHKNGNYYKCPKCKGPYAKMGYVDDCIKAFFRLSEMSGLGLNKIRKALVDIKNEQGISVPKQKKAIENRINTLDKKMKTIEDKLLDDDALIEKSRLESKYKPLKKEFKALQGQLKELNKPSNNLKDEEIEMIIEGLSKLDELYESYTKELKKQFLRFFISKAYIDTDQSKIVNYEFVNEFETLISKDYVLIASNWLPREDSNLEP